MQSLKSAIGKGIVIAIVMSIFWKLISLGAGVFFDAIKTCRALLAAVGIGPLLGSFFSFLVIAVLVWALGHIKPLEVIKYLLGKRAERSERKYLFCVRIKNFLGGYPIGLVTKVYDATDFTCLNTRCNFAWREFAEGKNAAYCDDMKCKKCYTRVRFALIRCLNIVFPNLGGMWTFIGIAEEDTERTPQNAEEMLLTSMSAGFL